MAFGDDLEGVGGKLTSDEDFFLILFVNLMFKVVLLKTYQLPCEITNLGTWYPKHVALLLQFVSMLMTSFISFSTKWCTIHSCDL